jgi:hypothetical protein
MADYLVATEDQVARGESLKNMNTLQLTQAPVAKAEMLIRKRMAEVFAAFVDPEITTGFWFTKSSG